MKKRYFSQFFVALFIICFTACTSIKPVSFKTPVDTTSKPIKYQTKKTFSIEDLGIYASNEFDGARLNDFYKLNDTTVVAYMEPENLPINNSAYYAFDVWSDQDQPMYISFKYPEQFKHRYHPKIKRNDTWAILDSTQVFSNNTDYVIKLNLSSKKTTVAAQKVQSSSKVKEWYTGISNTFSAKVSQKKIGSSALGRDLVVLDISNGDKKNKPIIVLLTRQHPPEVTGYFAFQEFVTTILQDEISDAFLKEYRVLAFPILNPDGVDLGHWRHNSNGVDTNRDWSLYHQPEIKQVVTYLTKQSKKSKAKIILGLDFHSTWYDVFYTNKQRETTSLPNFIGDWFSALEQNIEGYKVREASSNSTKPVSKGWFLYGLGETGVTYEIGDATPDDQIKVVGKVTAQQMMKILLKK